MDTKKFKILIVEDNVHDADPIIEILERESYEIDHIQNGTYALEFVKTNYFDLILLDIGLPEGNKYGFEVLVGIKTIPNIADIPVIFLTGLKDAENIKEGFEYGGADYITKPFLSEELLARVKTQLELKSQREELKVKNAKLKVKVNERTKQLEETLQELKLANKELKGLDIAKNNFLKIISHELRTPLTGIVGASEFLNTTLADDNEFGELVEMLKTSVDRLERFSKTALLITQLQTNQIYLKESVELDKLIKECITDNTESSQKKNITIIEEIIENNVIIEVERSLIKWALNSIIDNAIKYSDNNIIKIRLIVKNNYPTIECYDNGIGFSDKAIQNLFKPFSMGESHYDNNFGLSLKAVKHIMDVHNGEVIIYNNIRKGACVSLVFNN